MIEGQNGLNWSRWQRIARAVEDLGFAGLFRSDHYTNANPPDLDSLELWVSLTWLADHTRRINFGPMVTPISFRHPTLTARMASAVDDLSGGRLVLGLGAGWQEREHSHYGWDLLPPRQRFDRFEEGLEVITRLLNSDQPFDYSGSYFQVKEAILLPRPTRTGGPPILIGGNGSRRTLELAARYASEWNAIYLLPDRYRELNDRLNQALIAHGRVPADIKRSMMTNLVFGKSTQEVQERAGRSGSSPQDLRNRGIVVGTSSEVVDQLGLLAQAGAQQVMFQWLNLDDMDNLELFASQVLPQVRGD